MALVALVLSPALVGTLGEVERPPPPGQPTPAAADDRPNIVMILTDDQVPGDLRWMPLTRRLIGDAGARFDNFVSPNPLCCPARATLLTGQLSHNNGVRDNGGPYGGYPHFDDEHTVATWLHDGGYRTASSASTSTCTAGIPRPSPGGTASTRSPRGCTLLQLHLTNNGDPVDHLGSTATTTSPADPRLIEDYSADDQPFFIFANYVDHTRVHQVPRVNCYGAPIPAIRHRDLYPHVVAPDLAEPSFNENVADKARRSAP